MKKYPARLEIRLTSLEKETAEQLASGLDMTVSDYVRLLIKLPSPSDAETSRTYTAVIFDRSTMAATSRELKRWGNHYNQAVHALNTVAYYLRRDEADAADTFEVLERVNYQLSELAGGVDGIRGTLADMSGMPVLYM